MRRIKTVLGVVAVMAAMLVVFAAPALAQDISQDSEQEAESGDVDQSFEVTSEGDNSNQTAGIQGVSNTGNTQNQIGVIDAGDGFNNGDDFFNDDFDEFCDDNDDDDFCDFFDDDNRFFFDDDFDNGFGGFEFDDVGSSIEVSPTNVTSSDQQVNQAATASG
jgi:opacity protein-like surface antigen